jgi:polar amino acid transport system substrate-binding protein
MKLHSRRITLAAGTLAILASGVLTACGSSGNSSNSSTSATVNASGTASTSGTASAASLLPAKYKEAGEIRASTICDAPPYSYCDPGSTTPKGVFPDLGAAWAAELGVKLVDVNQSNDSLGPGVLAGRFDVVLANGDSPDRRTQFSFVDILQAGTSLLVKASNTTINGPATLCGLKVSATLGSQNLVELQAQAATCQKQGKPIDVIAYPSGSESVLGVQTGRVDAYWGDVGTNALLLKQDPGTFRIAGVISSPLEFGVQIAKSNTGLITAIDAAMKDVMKDGTYAAILKKWGLSQVGLSAITVNLKAT